MQSSSLNQNLVMTPRRRARRGAALMMVLSVVATGSILSWAMLSASATRSAVAINAADSIDAGYLAESGVSYALYYLRYPAKSPVALATDSNGITYYPGQSAVKLWSDAHSNVDIAVTNTGKYTYTVRSSTVVNGTRRTVEADVTQLTQGYQITEAAGFNANFTIPTYMTINGPVLATGTVGNQAGHITNSPTIVAAGSSVVPVASDVLILGETGTTYTGSGAVSTDRTYTYNGKTYAAEKITSSPVLLALQTLRSSVNPKNVWYTDTAVTFSGVNMTGTVVVRNGAALTMTGTNTITASAGMPALIASSKVELQQSFLLAGKLTVNGAAWVSDKVYDSNYTRNDGTFTVNGSLLMGGTSNSVALLGTSATSVTYNAANVSSVDNLAKTRNVIGVNVTGWRSVE